uniref:Uncharacterized protein n=1 Tax=Arundo donax TaxID=35708 RepID=A0A0A9CKK6_ARUDO
MTCRWYSMAAITSPFTFGKCNCRDKGHADSSWVKKYPNN